MQAASTSEFIFSAIRACLPARCASTVFEISSTIVVRIVVGETRTLRYWAGRPYPVKKLNISATSEPISGSAVNRPRSV